MTYDEAQTLVIGDRVESMQCDGLTVENIWNRGTVTALTRWPQATLNGPQNRVGRITTTLDKDGVPHSYLPSLVRRLTVLDAIAEVS